MRWKNVTCERLCGKRCEPSRAGCPLFKTHLCVKGEGEIAMSEGAVWHETELLFGRKRNKVNMQNHSLLHRSDRHIGCHVFAETACTAKVVSRFQQSYLQNKAVEFFTCMHAKTSVWYITNTATPFQKSRFWTVDGLLFSAVILIPTSSEMRLGVSVVCKQFVRFAASKKSNSRVTCHVFCKNVSTRWAFWYSGVKSLLKQLGRAQRYNVFGNGICPSTSSRALASHEMLVLVYTAVAQAGSSRSINR